MKRGGGADASRRDPHHVSQAYNDRPPIRFRMTAEYAQRVSRLTQSLPAHGLDGVILLPGPNLRFCTGLSFHLMGRPTLAILTVDRPPLLLVPELERSKAEGNTVGANVSTYGEDVASRQTAFADTAETLDLTRRRMGVGPLRMGRLEGRLPGD